MDVNVNNGDTAVEWLMVKFALDMSLVTRHDIHNVSGTHSGAEGCSIKMFTDAVRASIV